MASVRKKGQYTGEDRVDEWLLSQVKEHVNQDKAVELARTLGVQDVFNIALAATEDSMKSLVFEVRLECMPSIIKKKTNSIT